MKYTKENLGQGLTPEYISACKSLDMWLRHKYGGGPYLKGAISESRNSYWFEPPTIDGYRGSWIWASVNRGGESFGILAWSKGKTYSIEAKIPCDKLHWEIKEMEY